jgi:hypothetical protein
MTRFYVVVGHGMRTLSVTCIDNDNDNDIDIDIQREEQQ